MARQNRVTPWGEIIATPERGTLMGNRGLLHDGHERIRRDWRLKRWIHCVLEFKGRHREVMTPGRYTELFFLDEATALAAGHRPCAECLRSRYNEYRDAWAAGNRHALSSELPSAIQIDDVLHSDRLEPAGLKRTFTAELNQLSDGVIVTMEGSPNRAFLIRGDSLLAWSPGGYRQWLARTKGQRVSVLTPESTVAAIRSGFVPQIHATAGATC
jgi:hypothetical protein